MASAGVANGSGPVAGPSDTESPTLQAGPQFARFLEHSPWPTFFLSCNELAKVLLSEDLLSPELITGPMTARRSFFQDISSAPARRPTYLRSSLSYDRSSNGSAVSSDSGSLPPTSVPLDLIGDVSDETSPPPRLAYFPAVTKPKHGNKAWRTLRLTVGEAPLLDLMSPEDGHLCEDMLKRLCQSAVQNEDATLSAEVSLGAPYSAGDRHLRQPVRLVGQLLFFDDDEADDHARIQISVTSPAPFTSLASSITNIKRDQRLHTPGLAHAPDIQSLNAPKTPLLEGVPSKFVSIMQQSACGRLLLDHPWHKTKLGHLKAWPGQVLALLEFVMQSPYMTVLWLGEEGLMLYNETYAPALGDKHPGCFGEPGSEVWSEVWHQLGSVFEKAKAGEGTFSESSLYFLQQTAGKPPAERFYTFSMTPIHHADGRFLGALHVAHDETRATLLERRIRTLRNINAHTALVDNTAAYLRHTLSALDSNPWDLPFVIFYSGTLEKGVLQLHRTGTLGIAAVDTNAATPSCIRLKVKDTVRPPRVAESVDTEGTPRPLHAFEHVPIKTHPWPIASALTKAAPVFCEDVSSYVHLEPRGWSEPPKTAVCLPIFNETLHTVAICGLNPHQAYDERYGTFINLLSRQIATGIAIVRTYETAQVREKELADHLDIISDLVPCGILSIDTEGKVTYANPAWRKISGVNDDDPNNWAQYCHPDDLDRVLKSFQTAITSRQPHYIVEFRWRNGRHAQAEVRCVEQQVGPIDFVACVNDTTNIKRLEAMHIEAAEQKAKYADEQARGLEQRATEAEQNRRLQELSIDVSSHELRNPLSGLHQNAELIAENLSLAKSRLNALRELGGPQPELVAELLEIMDGNVESIESILLCSTHMQRISHDILAFSKANMGLLELVIEPFSLRELVASSLRMFNAELKEHRVHVMNNASAAVSDLNADFVYGDGHRLSQVLINLLTNAVRFIALRSIREITISIEASHQQPETPSGAMRVEAPSEMRKGEQDLWVSIAVEDTGPGLTPAEMSKLFKRFSQVSPQRDGLSGFGLGLFVSLKVCQLHGGYIEVSSVKGKGTTFIFGWPTRRADSKNAARPSLPPSLVRAKSMKVLETVKSKVPQSGPPSRVPSPVRAGRVLVAEDNMINLRVLVRQLQQHKYDTISARDGLEALNAYKEHHAELHAACFDVEMPFLSGTETIIEIRKIEAARGDGRRLPVIAVTGNARDKQIEACKDAGFDAVATKPYSIRELVALIESTRSSLQT